MSKKKKIKKRTSKKVKRKIKVRKKTSKKLKKKIKKENINSAPEIIIKTKREWLKQGLANKSQYQKKYNESIKNNPEELSKIGERLDLINSLLSKHSKQNISELLSLLDEMKTKIQSSTHSESIMKEKEERLENVKKELSTTAGVLTKKRKSVRKEFQKNVESHLRKLGITSPEFIIDIQQRNDFNISGNDIINFMFSGITNGLGFLFL